MPTALIYLLSLFAFICLYFVITKRPIYEAMFLGFILMLVMTGTWQNAFTFMWKACQTSLVYAIIAFIALSRLLTKTGVIDSCIAVILSLFGRVTGGAGYVAVIASTFMGALSGSGPGNVMATGVITIPAMKKSGFPSYLAANVESASSTMGNMIPPSGIIVAAFGCYTAFAPNDDITVGKFWLILWSIAIYFIIQRIVTLFAFCKYYKVQPMKKSELPPLGKTIKEGWKGLLLPIVILAPFIVDAQFSELFISRLGKTGAKYFSSSLLLFVAGIAAIYTIIISKDKKIIRPSSLANIFTKSLKAIVPTVATVIFAYAIGEIFSSVGAGESLTHFFEALNMNRLTVAFAVPLFTTILGMIFPGSSQIAMFGTMLVGVMAASGISPLLAAAMLPTICGSMSGITPPVAVCMFAAMGIAESEYKPTVINCLFWVCVQYVISVLLLLGIFPVFGV